MPPAAVRQLLDERLPADRRAQLEAVRRLASQPLYLAGGCLRDLLLGRPPGDFDFVLEGDAPAFARTLARALGGTLTVHPAFRTATWHTPAGADIDFAMARSERYPQPADLPLVAPAAIHQDLGRRDFTINALALRLDGEHLGELLDPYAGQADLQAGLVRVLHPASFQDDPTRLFRAVRYEQRLGFQLAPDTLAVLPAAGPVLAALSPDRLRHEFELIFREPSAAASLARLQALGLLALTHPALSWPAAAPDLAHWPPAAWRLPALPAGLGYWAGLLAQASFEAAQSALARVNLGRELSRALTEALSLRPDWDRPSAAVAALDRLSLAGVAAAHLIRPEARAWLDPYLSVWRLVQPRTRGNDLAALGLPAGPIYADILWRLRAAWLDGEVRDAAAERALVEQLARRG